MKSDGSSQLTWQPKVIDSARSIAKQNEAFQLLMLDQFDKTIEVLQQIQRFHMFLRCLMPSSVTWSGHNTIRIFVKRTSVSNRTRTDMRI